ncbi:MAG: hypothetical protein A2Y45_00325 [Tenericutes bacterium GWC2_34_14]|nr:MAG: hypothetical protein A2Z84_07780 [Tenericutes bacterium GWA2_35_7]OHE29348.1 MAG: hypothetical protein A2Y45_00325 [Tenericutes bacterium GWC2_34_14]OHE34445.1 MAG: hypothetical protein A2012_07945 [Tenericutes bacterium GWE2_34_108]OHE35801.1 MAG: hypothetical protein A2Y46_02650 [Tenericutes bacterium GWF1_35_14]OHE39112.1 MAG: hypothetical protein A2Y44_07280 [Tenericutes bacterium GWF2_35_184]OHE42821.1 MAG: hypothetical protein A2221_08955 [Tenericutes bacterium RIFOXYA2_FULL_36_3
MFKLKLLLQVKDVLNQFPEANRFSLTGPFDKNINALNPYGIYRITKENADYILSQLTEVSMDFFKASYNTFKEEDKKNLPPFNELVENIKLESLNHVQASIRNDFKDHIPINDLFMDEKTLFTHPPQLYHFYHHFEHLFSTYLLQIEHMLKHGRHRDLDDVFEDEKYKDLKLACISKELTYVWHSTISNRLSVLYTFELGESSKAWLLKQEDVFGLSDLEDLALYKDDEILFSSNTHEKMYKDVRTDEDYSYLED